MTQKRLTIPALAIGLLCTGYSAFAQQSAPIKPEAKSFKVGRLQISSLHDNGFAAPNNGSLFGATPDAVAKVLAAAGAPTDTIPLDVDALLVRLPNKIVLIDTGLGAAGHGVLLQSLALVGVSPDQITDILITHAHSDHVGGLLNGSGQPAFPNATIRLSSTEWTFMQNQDDTRVEAAAISRQIKTFEPGSKLLPGITPISLPGHTPGMVGYEIYSDGHCLIDIADIAHSSIVSLARPDWTIKWDSNKAEAYATRRRELSKLATTHELIFAPHFPFPGVGKIEKSGSGFRFEPQLPSDR